MIRQMRRGEENEVRTLYAKLSFEDQSFWRKQAKPIEEYLEEAGKIPTSENIEGKNVILVAEEAGKVIGFCWCTIVDRGIDREAEIAEFYVERQYRSKGLGEKLVAAAKRLFINEGVRVAFFWTHHGNNAAIQLCKKAGFKEVDQVVMALVLSSKDEKLMRGSVGIGIESQD